jgi:hypothetical protein
MSWFEVDKDGLRQLQEGKDKSYIPRELLQNAWDEKGVTGVGLTIEPVPGKVAARVRAADDAPEGFYDLTHAWTLFKKTRKRKDPTKRGRFNFGEKEVLAVARWAHLVTTKGTVRFMENGERRRGRTTTQKGSVFTAEIPMTRAEIADAIKATKTFIPPSGIRTTINGEELVAPEQIANIAANLPTEFENTEGQYRQTRRNTTIRVYKPRPGEKPMIYEMGLPIIELEGGDIYHYDIQQRVPMTSDRDNVRPSFLQDVRAEVLNMVGVEELSREEVSERWVTEALEDDRIDPQAVQAVVTKRFGEKVVTMDPSDHRANETAIAEGYTIVPGGSLTGAAWKHVKEAAAIPASSSLFGSIGVEAVPIQKKKWTPQMKRVGRLVERMVSILGQPAAAYEFVRSKAHDGATWDGCTISFNVTRLGRRWFSVDNTDQQVRLIVHELAHRYGGHLDMSYHKTLCCWASVLAFTEPREVTKGITRGLKLNG